MPKGTVMKRYAKRTAAEQRSHTARIATRDLRDLRNWRGHDWENLTREETAKALAEVDDLTPLERFGGVHRLSAFAIASIVTLLVVTAGTPDWLGTLVLVALWWFALSNRIWRP